MEPQTIQELAREARAAFSKKTREDGSEFWTYGLEAPEWVKELTSKAHGNGPGSMLPDDTRYVFIIEALDALEEAEDVDEVGHDWEFEPYYGRLVDWLGTYAGHRLEYCDDWAREYGPHENGAAELLQGGQLYERLEVLDLVRASLEAHLETLAAA
jgi:hypothetical protein